MHHRVFITLSEKYTSWEYWSKLPFQNHIVKMRLSRYHGSEPYIEYKDLTDENISQIMSFVSFRARLEREKEEETATIKQPYTNIPRKDNDESDSESDSESDNKSDSCIEFDDKQVTVYI